MSTSFDNLYDFFNYIEFCPLCKNRTTSFITSPGGITCGMDNKELTIYSSSSTSTHQFSINLFTNEVSKPYSIYRSGTSQIIVGKQCNKYHFFYNGVLDISGKELLVKRIRLDKYHFIRMHGTTHFTVNGSLLSGSTNIRITTPDFQTKELSLPLIDFNFSSKKKIDSKLRNIQLLG